MLVTEPIEMDWSIILTPSWVATDLANSEIFAPGISDYQSLSLPMEELNANISFQGLNLVAYRALGHTELLRRTREAFVTRCGLE